MSTRIVEIAIEPETVTPVTSTNDDTLYYFSSVSTSNQFKLTNSPVPLMCIIFKFDQSPHHFIIILGH